MQRYYKVSIVILVVLIVFVGVFGSLYLYNQTQLKNSEVYTPQVEASVMLPLNNNDFTAAIDNVDVVLKKQPNSTDALLTKATIIAQRGSLTFNESADAEEARIYIQQVLDNDPNNSNAWRLLGYTHEIQEQYTEAHAAYAKSLEIDPNNALTLSQQAHAYDLQGDLVKAKAGYEAALDITPTLTQANAGMARIAVFNEDLDTAFGYLNKVLEYSNNKRELSEAAYTVGFIHMVNGDMELALKSMEDAVQFDPMFPTAKVGLAEVSFELLTRSALSPEEKQIKANEIIELIGQAIDLNPNQTAAYFKLGLILMYMGNTEASIALTEKALEVLPSDITLSEPAKAKLKETLDVTLLALADQQ